MRNSLRVSRQSLWSVVFKDFPSELPHSVPAIKANHYRMGRKQRVSLRDTFRDSFTSGEHGAEVATGLTQSSNESVDRHFPRGTPRSHLSKCSKYSAGAPPCLSRWSRVKAVAASVVVVILKSTCRCFLRVRAKRLAKARRNKPFL
jgi:hypothetical protein